MGKKITRKEAVAKKLELYYTGDRCARGHLAERFVLGDRKTGKRRSRCVRCWEIDNPPPKKVVPEQEHREDLGVMGNYY